LFRMHALLLLLLSWGLIMGDFSQYCHEDIASVLACKLKPASKARSNVKLWDGKTFTFPTTTSTNDLVAIALECDNLVFSDETENELWNPSSFPFLQAMADMGRGSASCAASATLLALNGLESTIRISTGYQTGRAPLLKTMISEIEPSTNVSSVCELLLLPQGINLRNLLWHGFVAKLPRPWLALVLVVTWFMLPSIDDDDKVEMLPQQYPVMKLRSHSELQRLLGTSKYDILDENPSPSIAKWLPETHRDLWGVAVAWVREKKYPASTCAVFCILLEHGLRLDWCRWNDRPSDAMARPGVFYVTLDGHGQRNLHDLLLHPYLLLEGGEENNHRPNLLVREHLDASTVALLTDLFCSSCGGPNIRATVSHGLWDYYLKREWTDDEHGVDDDNPELWDMVRALLLAMELVAAKSEMIDYRPIFSYASATGRNLISTKESLAQLDDIHRSCDYQKYLAFARGVFGAPPKELDLLATNNQLKDDQLPDMLTRISNLTWTADSVYEEHKLNQQLANAGATRVLLHDIAAATCANSKKVTESLLLLQDDEETNKRKRKTALRIVHSSQLARTLYRFATRVAILSLQQETAGGCMSPSSSSSMDPKLLLKAIERSRMVVSTVDNILYTQVDRAIKSVQEYTKGKAIKCILYEDTNDD
jgi:hypothetical protein